MDSQQCYETTVTSAKLIDLKRVVKSATFSMKFKIEFDVHSAMRPNISVVKPTRCTKVSNLFYFGITLYMFRTVFPSIIRSSRLYMQQKHVSNRYSRLLARKEIGLWGETVIIVPNKHSAAKAKISYYMARFSNFFSYVSGFKSRAGRQPPWLKFSWFSSASAVKWRDITSNITHHFQFIIH